MVLLGGNEQRGIESIVTFLKHFVGNHNIMHVLIKNFFAISENEKSSRDGHACISDVDALVMSMLCKLTCLLV